MAGRYCARWMPVLALPTLFLRPSRRQLPICGCCVTFLPGLHHYLRRLQLAGFARSKRLWQTPACPARRPCVYSVTWH